MFEKNPEGRYRTVDDNQSSIDIYSDRSGQGLEKEKIRCDSASGHLNGNSRNYYFRHPALLGGLAYGISHTRLRTWQSVSI